MLKEKEGLIGRLIIESMEGRVLLGIVMFVGVMVLVGWVAINEPARMASFERQHLGRSIERGAELFAANCSTCHGALGLGIAERAPALNNPQLFGHSFINPINAEIGRRERQIVELNTQMSELNRERDALFAEAASNPGAERLRAITERIQAIDVAMGTDDPNSLPNRIAAIEAELEPMIAERATLLESLQAATDKGFLPGLEAAQAAGGLTLTQYLERDSNRLLQAGWGGDLRSFLTTTLVHGRPGSQDAWGGTQMVAWAQRGGGPLRDDQIADIVNYILNWDKGDNWTTEDLFAVGQFTKLKADASMVASGPAVAAIGRDTDAALVAVTALTGDPVRGQAIYKGEARTEVRARLACSSCHLGGLQAPATEVTWANTLSIRLADPANAGQSPEYYIINSILHPNDYVVAPYASGVMPLTYPDQLTAQDLADIIAYLRSYAEGS